MNCKQVDELLPLYAGRDLDEKRARLVSEHLQICSACARVAGEYREAIELTQHFATPVFTDHVYTSVRRQVMQEIEDESAAPLLPQIFGSLLRPRMAWAAASALIFAFGFFALYLVVNRKSHPQPVANIQPAVNGPEQNPDATAIPPANGPVGVEKKKPAEHSRRGFMNRPPLVKVEDSPSRAATISPKFREPATGNRLPAVHAGPGESPLRVEMQTKDPNIRIIWFSQSNSKPALPTSKGI